MILRAILSEYCIWNFTGATTLCLSCWKCIKQPVFVVIRIIKFQHFLSMHNHRNFFWCQKNVWEIKKKKRRKWSLSITTLLPFLIYLKCSLQIFVYTNLQVLFKTFPKLSKNYWWQHCACHDFYRSVVIQLEDL